MIDKYYYLLFGLIVFGESVMTALDKNVGFDWKVVLFLLSFALFTVGPESRRDVKWVPFLVLTVPIILLVQYLNVHGYALWGKMLSWQMSKDIVFNLNDVFRKIPLNDASFTRLIQPEFFTKFMRFVYQNGFVLPALLPIYRAAVAKDLRKMLRYLLSAHVFQVFLITPFYLTFHLQEVWYVLGHPDGMARNLSPEAAAGVTLNCFPSMHTSIAFAMFLVLLNEKNRLFKAVWGFYCLSVVYSTMYLEIHWVIDVIAGILLAVGTVKLVDFVLAKAESFIPIAIRNVYFKDSVPTMDKLPSFEKSF